MSEEQKDPKRIEPAETEHSQPPDISSDVDSVPADVQPAETGEGPGSAPSGRPQAPEPQGDDFVSEIRHDLASEEKSAEHRPGGLIRRITGSLRRQTGPLQKQAEPQVEESAPEPQAAPPPVEIPDDFLADRLGGASAAEPSAPDFDQIQLPPSWDLPEGWPPAQDETGAPAAPLFADDFLTGEELPLDSDPFAVNEESGVGGLKQQEPDWMAEIRSTSGEGLESGLSQQEQEETEKPQDEPQKPAARTGPLAFITGILRGAEERRRREAGEEMPDEMVAGRLERSLGAGAADEAAPPESAESEPFLAEEAAVEPEADIPPLFAIDDDLLVGEEFQPHLRQSIEPFIETPGIESDLLVAPGDTNILPEISAEDELLLWGESVPPVSSSPAEGPTFTPEDVWGEPDQPAQREAPPPPGRRSVDDLFAETFLTGVEAVPENPQVYSQDQLLKDALEKSPAPEESVSLEDLRQVALEGYHEGEARRAAGSDREAEEKAGAALVEEPVGMADDASVIAAEAAATAAQAEVLEEWEQKQPGPRPSLREWLSSRTTIEKILLVEAVVVALALMIAVPFFIFQLSRGPAQDSGLSPRPLPANLPYPTGIELPGGWSFSLARSTFEAGRWKPAAAEWLDGTELRRVVALPWNEQTEAVFQTFMSGDAIRLMLSNGDMVEYTITSVERISAADTSIFTDTSPSMVVILYREKAEERWVVFSKP